MSVFTSLLTEPVHQGPAEATPPEAPGEHTAPDASKRPPLVGFVLQYWRSEDRWTAWALLAITLGITFFVTYLMVWANQLLGQVTDAIVNRNWGLLLPTFATSIGVGVLSGLVVISNVAIGQVLDLRWRTWLTERCLARWTSCSRFYDVERDGLLKNADQRIAEDVRIFTDTSLNLFTSLVSAVTHIVTFVVLLWGLSQSIEIPLFGSTWVVYGYMVYIAFAWAIGGLAVTHYFGKKLIALNMQKQGVEADYRYLAMQLRENAEQIALYKGGEREHRRLTERFGHVKRNFLQIVARTWKVDTARNTYGLFFDPLGTVAALPLYIAGKVTYGGMMRAAGAFGALKQALSFFAQAYVGFTHWLAVTNRLRDLYVALEAAEARGMDGITVTAAKQDAITTRGLCLDSPTGERLTSLAPLAFQRGERWLVRGPSGAGKSTLLRAIAGIWPHGSGAVCMPLNTSFLFLPQRSYIPSGTLAAALSYPGDPDQFPQSRLLAVLHACGLGRLEVALNVADHWQQKLSGGEQQRLAFARVLLHRPDFVFLDEATSALDPETERMLYETVLAQLPDAGVISIAHREALAAFHDHVLQVSPAAGRHAGPGEPAQLS